MSLPPFLNVKIISGKALVARDTSVLDGNTSDPFVKINYIKNGEKPVEKAKTKVVKKSLYPTWNETFAFPLIGGMPVAGDVLQLECWDEDLLRNDYMGYFSVPLDNVAKAPVKGAHVLLGRLGKNDKVTGEINAEIWISDVPSVPCAPSSHHVQRAFIQPIWEGRYEEVIAGMHPNLQKLIDPTIFEARFRNFRTRLGHCVDSSFEQSKGVTIENGVKTANEEKKFFFERGAALVSLEFVNDKLVEFAFDTEGIGNVLPEIPVSDLYTRGLVFWDKFFDLTVTDDDVYAMLSEPLRQTLDKPKFIEMRQAVHGPGVGKLATSAPNTTNDSGSLQLQESDNGPKLVLEYKLEQYIDGGEAKRPLLGTISWVLGGFQMHLFGFFVKAT